MIGAIGSTLYPTGDLESRAVVGPERKIDSAANSRISRLSEEKSRSISRVLYDRKIAGSHSSWISITENL